MKMLLLGLALLTLFLSRVPAVAAVAPPPLPEVIPLDNGARLIVLHEPDAPFVAIDVFFRVGLADEGGNGGILSLLTRAWVTAAQGRNEVQLGGDIGRLGGNVGAWFDGDWTEIWAVSAADETAYQESAATLLWNLVGRPAFSEEAVEAARQELLRAIETERDDPLRHALDRLRARAWDRVPYARSRLGSEEAVRSLTTAQVRKFYADYFRPDRAVIVVAGRLTPAAARRLVESNLKAGGWEEKRLSPPEPTVMPEAIPPNFRDRAISRRAPATILLAGFLTPGVLSNGGLDYPALLVLDALLGGGKGARLYRALRDTRPLGYEVRTMLQAGRHQGLLTGYVIASGTGEGSDPAAVRARIRTELLAEMQALGKPVAEGGRPATETELSRARAFLKGRHAAERQRLKDRAFGAGWAEVMGLGADFDARFDARMDAVTAEEVARLARAVLGGNPVVVYTQAE